MAALLLAVVAFFFFYPDAMEGRVLQQHDIMQGLANGQEGKAFTEATGETSRWTNSLFSGMPTYQIAPSYSSAPLLDWISGVYMLGLPSPANLLFAMMAGFFIMCLCMKMKWPTALFAALAWGFSSYFIIIIGAGHIWKFLTLCYIPPTIGGIVLCYRGRYLGGTALASVFGALQLQSNHPQMTYYFLFVIAALVIAWLVTAVRSHSVARWGIATACCCAAGLLAFSANCASIINTLEYSKETVRGRASYLTPPDGSALATSGMDRQAITAWSYGVDETLTLLVPNVKGGATIKPEGGVNRIMSSAETEKADRLPLSQEERMFMGQFPQYFGDQPMTNGPVYVGALVLMLAVLAMFIVGGPVAGPVKWALFSVSILAVLLSWGHNFSAFTDFFIDWFPGYSKFRTVSSILVIVEFCVPLLAAMAVGAIISRPACITANPMTFGIVFGAGALICFLGWIAPSIFGQAFSQSEIDQLSQMGVFTNPMYANLLNGIRESRLSLVSGDCLRSMLFILIGGGLIWIYAKGMISNPDIFVIALTAVVLIDLFTVDKRYIDSDSFTEPAVENSGFEMTEADRAILSDTAMNYRVMDIDHFGEARSSYFHKTIGGYHAAKLTRYNDLIDRQISRNNMGVLNMLNARYFIVGDSAVYNPDALGNAWIADRLTYVGNDDAEMGALDNLDTSTEAVANQSMRSILGEASPRMPGDTVFETSYAPNRLTYHARSAKGGVAVFSEIYFSNGWKAMIDGKEVPIARANYTLRALRLPAGEHTVEFTFDPETLKTTDTLSVIAVVIIYVLCGGALAYAAVGNRRKKRKEETPDGRQSGE